MQKNNVCRLIVLSILLFISLNSIAKNEPNHPHPAKFSIAQIPDIQSYFSHTYFPLPGVYDSPAPYSHPLQIFDMYKWIVDQQPQRNFVYIAQVGDIIEMGGICNSTDRAAICRTNEEDPPIPDASFYKHSETFVEWKAVNSIYSLIEQYMKHTGEFIPMGFAMGNHDPRALSVDQSVAASYGHGDLSPNTTISVRKFMQARYNNSQYSGIPTHHYLNLNKYGFSDSYLLSYYEIPIKQTAGVPITILNLPYNFQTLPGLSTEINSFIHKQKRLIILVTHKCIEGKTSLMNNKNVLMLLCGHDPYPVNTNGNYTVTPPAIYAGKKVYQFDYQGMGLSGNLPQQPLVRFYDFWLEHKNHKIFLHWRANDVRAWREGRVLTAKGLNLDPDGFYAHKPPFVYAPNNNGWSGDVEFKQRSKTIDDGKFDVTGYLADS